MKSENLIHVKLEYEEARQSKKDVLSLEMTLLKILRTIKEYHPLRLEELKIKLRLYRKIKELIADMGKLQIALPKLKIPEILKEEGKLEGTKIKEIKTGRYDGSLEAQLREIQDKLNKLQM